MPGPIRAAHEFGDPGYELDVTVWRDLVGDADDTLFSLQVNFTIGSHPAHLY